MAGAVAMAVSVTGCAGILGLEDRELDSDASSAGASSSSGSLDGSVPPDGRASLDGSPSADGGAVRTDGAPSDTRGDKDGGEIDAPADAPLATPDAMSICPPTGTCVLASGLNDPWLLAADDTNVYWTELGTALDTGDGAVKSCAIDGCVAPRVYAANVNGARGIAVDGTNVYWSAVADDNGVGGGVFACPITGCVGAPLLIGSGTSPYGVAVDATYVYWVDENDLSVSRARKDGTGHQYLIAPSDPNNPLSDPCQIAIDSTDLYINDCFNGLYREPLSGGEPELLYDDGNEADWPVAVDSTSVYTSDSPGHGLSDGTVWQINKAGLGVTAIATGLIDPIGLAVDTTVAPSNVYWADFGSSSVDGTLGRVSSNGTGQQNIATSYAPSATALGGGYLFWADVGTSGATGSIRRVPK